MVSYGESGFAEDMGYREGGDPLDERLGGWNPGVSTFRREGGRIVRLSDTELGPWDAFCVVWHLFDLIPDADPTWRPRYSYAQESLREEATGG